MSSFFPEFLLNSRPKLIKTFTFSVFIFFLVCVSYHATAQFTRLTTHPFPQVRYGTLAWGDYDNDGDMDLYLTGEDNSQVKYSRLYRNEGSNAWTLIATGITPSTFGSSQWIDYDSDGDVDLMVSGDFDGSYNISTRIYRNDGNDTFSRLNITLKSAPTFSWADYDRDGDPDLVTMDAFYRNDNGTLVEVPATETGLSWIKVAKFVDLNNDGFPDVVSNYTLGNGGKTAVYLNQGNGTFSQIPTNLPQVLFEGMQFGDYNNDGYMDLVATHRVAPNNQLAVYRNLGNANFAIGVSISALAGPLALGDYDSDGDLDVMVAGFDGGYQVARVLRNDGASNFVTAIHLQGSMYGAATFADFTNDGKLDIVYAGNNTSTTGAIHVYQNNVSKANTAPGPVSSIAVSRNRAAVTVTWTGSTDADGSRLSYNVAAGTDGIGINTLSPMADLANGKRMVVEPGNAGTITKVDFRNLPDGTYTFRVQSIDHGYAGSTFEASEPFAYIAPLPAPFNFTVVEEADQRIVLYWSPMEGEGFSHYKLYRETTPTTDPTNVIYESTPGDNLATGYTDEGMANDVTYYYYLSTVKDGEIEGAVVGVEAVPFDITLVPLHQPANLQTTTILDTITLSWNQNHQEHFSHYRVYRETAATNSPSNVIHDSEPGNREDTIFHNTNVPHGIQYHYYVTTVNEKGIESELAAISAGTIALNPPTGLDSETSYESITVSWVPDNQQYFLYYRVYRETAATASPSNVVFDSETGNREDTSYTDTNINHDVDYHYYITTVDIRGVESTPSLIVAKFILLKSHWNHSSTGGTNASAWADFDTDGDLDVVTITEGGSGLYINNNGTLTRHSFTLPNYRNASLAWGDYDNDGDQDLIVCGSFSGTGYTNLYKNDGGTFVLVESGLPGILSGTVKLEDFDNDGDLDVFLSGRASTQTYPLVTKLLYNTAGTFTDSGIQFPILNSSPVAAVGDYDSDGDLDIYFSGNGTYTQQAYLLKNDGRRFTEVSSGLRAIEKGSAVFADYDNDGDPDILITGNGTTFLYQNTGGVFARLTTSFPYLSQCTAAWGDYDNNGYPDLLLTGLISNTHSIRLFSNTEGVFTEQKITAPGMSNGTISWGDFNNDDRLDLLLSGAISGGGSSTGVYVNQIPATNSLPGVPGNLSFRQEGSKIYFSWDAAEDPENGPLTYNIRVGTDAEGFNIMNGMAGTDGKRLLPKSGNAGVSNGSFYFDAKETGIGTYNWNVQAIDAAFGAGQFSIASSFEVVPFIPEPDTLIAETDINMVKLSWTPEEADVFKYFKVYRETEYMDEPVNLIHTTAEGNSFDTSFTDNQVVNFTKYYYYVTAVSTFDIESDPVYTSAMSSQFKEQDIVLPGIRQGASSFIDIDNDGDLDLFMTGLSTSDTLVTKILTNHDGAFTEMASSIPGLKSSSADWADYDLDGDLDLVLSGITSQNVKHTAVYANNSGAFEMVEAGLVQVAYGAVAWGDYDNDGYPDLVVTGAGEESEQNFSKIYRNDRGNFVDIQANLPAVRQSSVAWGDYNHDGKLDLVIGGNIRFTEVWDPYWQIVHFRIENTLALFRNEGNNSFTRIRSFGHGLTDGVISWIDYDNDGLLDLHYVGNDTAGIAHKLFLNDNNDFVEKPLGLYPLASAKVVWADFSNDGRLDLLLTGGYQNKCKLYYQNEAGELVNTEYEMPVLNYATVSGGDYNGDGKLDYFIAGQIASGYNGLLYKNLGDVNMPPLAPAGLEVTQSGDQVDLGWGMPSDPEGGTLSYNVRIGTAPGHGDILNAMVVPESHIRTVVKAGNAGINQFKLIDSLPEADYYWSVQAIDNAFTAGPWSEEQRLFRRKTMTTQSIQDVAGAVGDEISIDLTNHFVSTSDTIEVFYTITVTPEGNITVSGQDLEQGILNFVLNQSGLTEVQVTARNEFGEESSLLFNIDVVNGTTTSQLPKLSVYPNPTASKLSVNLPDNYTGKANLKIFSSISTSVLDVQVDINDGKTMVDLSQLEQGSFLMIITTDDTAHTVQVQKY